VVFSKQLDALAWAAAVEAVRLDEQEALQRVIERQQEQTDWKMAGLRLTPSQAARLWGLSSSATAALLDMLVDVGFLACTEDGTYHR
jgi:hypothetical protein